MKYLACSDCYYNFEDHGQLKCPKCSSGMLITLNPDELNQMVEQEWEMKSWFQPKETGQEL